jgi:hypothetical protein
VRALPYRRIFFQGFLTNVLNPKVALFFLAFVPQFIDADAPTRPLAFIVLGCIFNFNGMLWCNAPGRVHRQASARLKLKPAGVAVAEPRHRRPVRLARRQAGLAKQTEGFIMSDILNKILAVKADEVAAAKKHRDLASLRREVEGDAELRAGICAASKPACAATSPPAMPA